MYVASETIELQELIRELNWVDQSWPRNDAGLNVATNPNFDGRLCDIEPLFKQHLNQFVPLLLSPDNVTVRKISGQEVRCKELVRYLRAYVDIFKASL